MAFAINNMFRGMTLFKHPLCRREVLLLIIESSLFLLAAVDLGLTRSSAAGMKSDLGFLSVPMKLQFNIGLAVATLLIVGPLIFLDLTMPPFWYDVHRNKQMDHAENTDLAENMDLAGNSDQSSTTGLTISKYNPWIRVAISTILSLFWVGAIATSVYSCGDLCPATNRLGNLNYANICCNCVTSTESVCLPYDGQFEHIEQRTGRYGATQALNSIAMILFLTSAGIWLSFKWRDISTRHLFPGEA